MKIEMKMYFADMDSLKSALTNLVNELDKCDMGTVESYPFYIGSFRRIENDVDVTDLDSGVHW
jgi:hypothetical protein